MDNVILEDHFTQYAISASREYQEIHPYSAVNIDSVKINTFLIMMKECIIPEPCLIPEPFIKPEPSLN